MILKINTLAVVKFTNKLEKIHRSALPIAIRSSLNDAVFDVKTNTMPFEAKSDFTQRQKNFFTANSKFEAAKGFDIKSMSSSVGFYENKLKESSTNYSVKDLEEQESGGQIDGKTFIPTIFARSGKKDSGLVRPNARIKAIRKRGIIEAKKTFGRTSKQKFVVAAHSAVYAGTPYVMHEHILYQILSANGKKIKAIPLYSVKKGRSVSVSGTHFMRDASLKSGEKLNAFFFKNAQKQLKKYYGKL